MTFVRIVGILLVLVMVGCESRRPFNIVPPRFDNTPKIILDAKLILIQDKYTPPLKDPNIEHNAPIMPVAAATQWARDRLQGSAEQGTFEFIIEEASIIEEKLEKSGGVKGLITTEQDALLTARLKVRAVFNGVGGQELGYAVTEVTQSRSIPEGISLQERDEALQTLVHDLMIAFDREMESRLRNDLGQYVL